MARSYLLYTKQPGCGDPDNAIRQFRSRRTTDGNAVNNPSQVTRREMVCHTVVGGAHEALDHRGATPTAIAGMMGALPSPCAARL